MFVLIHSPLTGLGTWRPVADALRARQIDVAMPHLVDDGSPPFWRQHVRCVVRGIAEDVEPGRPLVLAAHGAAGQLLGVLGPVLHDAGYEVAAEILADAGLPPGGRSRLEQLDDESPEAAEEVRRLLDDGVGYPAWTDEQIAPLIPDDDLRHRFLDELRRPPAAFWVEQIPTAVDWPDAPVGVVVFSSAYEPAVGAARDHDWPVRVLAGENHLLPLADGERVAAEVLALAGALVGDDTAR